MTLTKRLIHLVGAISFATMLATTAQASSSTKAMLEHNGLSFVFDGEGMKVTTTSKRHIGMALKRLGYGNDLNAVETARVIAEEDEVLLHRGEQPQSGVGPWRWPSDPRPHDPPGVLLYASQPLRSLSRAPMAP